jgi:hypothetical protein
MKTVIYSLRKDKQKIDQIQKATLETDEFGLQQTHGLFGSTEWWAKIADGNLPLRTASGLISKVYLGSMGDWPEFKMCQSDGTELTWAREAQSKELDNAYKEGAVVEIDYVMQSFKPKSWNGATETKCVIEIRVGSQ